MKKIMLAVLILSSVSAFARIKQWPRGFKHMLERKARNDCNANLKYKETAFCNAAASCYANEVVRQFPSQTAAERIGLRTFKQRVKQIAFTCRDLNRNLLTGRYI